MNSIKDCLPLFLTPLAFSYGMMVRLRNFFFDSGFFAISRLPGQVVSVGNIAIGGTGKTPVTIRIASELCARGYRPAILTRGYHGGLRRKEFVVLLGGKIRFQFSPKGDRYLDLDLNLHLDEARLQSERLVNVPVVVGADRIQAAKFYLKACTDHPPTHWIMDDGFQHRRLFRNFDIVLIDAAAIPSDFQLLPVGSSRESLNGLKRANLVLLTRAKLGSPSSELMALIGKHFSGNVVEVPFVVSDPYFVLGTFDLRKGAALAVCAIADGERFFRSLEKMGINVKTKIKQRDHACFSKKVLQEKSKECDFLVTTEKDYWRDPSVFIELTIPVCLLPLNALIEPDQIATILENICGS